MKKTFPLTHPKIKPERLVEGIRADVNKYVKRERKKTLPEGVDFWDFACKVGANAERAVSLHLAEVSNAIGKVLEDGHDAVYVEILAKPGKRTKKEL
jgi:hypothetical protein